MTKYIKGKDGKFVGSIGEGRDSTPAAPPSFSGSAPVERKAVDLSKVNLDTAAPKTSPEGETRVPTSADLKSLLGSTKIIELGRDDVVRIGAHGPEAVVDSKVNEDNAIFDKRVAHAKEVIHSNDILSKSQVDRITKKGINGNQEWATLGRILENNSLEELGWYARGYDPKQNTSRKVAKFRIRELTSET